MDIVFVTAGASLAHEDFESGDLSGTESQINGIAHELVGRGHNVRILRRGEKKDVTETTSGIHIIDIPAPTIHSQIPTKLRFSRQVEKYLRNDDADVINITMKYAALFSCRLSKPVIHFAFNNPAAITPNTGILRRITTGSVEKWVSYKSDAVIVRNNAVANWAHQQSTGVVEQIPCGIDVDRYENSGDENYILYGGRFAPIKNVDHILRSYARLPSALRNQYDLQLVGEGPDEEQLRLLTEELGVKDNVNFHPWMKKNKFQRKISQSSCIALPSDQEGMPVFAIEAMACEKPVIGSDVPGINDLVDDHETGILFQPGDIDEFSHAFQYVLKNHDRRKYLGETARKKIERQHNFEQITDEYLDLYRKLLNQ